MSDACRLLLERHIRRMPVVDSDGRLVQTPHLVSASSDHARNHDVVRGGEWGLLICPCHVTLHNSSAASLQLETLQLRNGPDMLMGVDVAPGKRCM